MIHFKQIHPWKLTCPPDQWLVQMYWTYWNSVFFGDEFVSFRRCTSKQSVSLVNWRSWAQSPVCPSLFLCFLLGCLLLSDLWVSIISFACCCSALFLCCGLFSCSCLSSFSLLLSSVLLLCSVPLLCSFPLLPSTCWPVWAKESLQQLQRFWGAEAVLPNQCSRKLPACIHRPVEMSRSTSAGITNLLRRRFVWSMNTRRVGFKLKLPKFAFRGRLWWAAGRRYYFCDSCRFELSGSRKVGSWY